MRKFAYGITFALLAISVIAAILLGAVALQQREQLFAKEAELGNANQQIQSLEDMLGGPDGLLNFSDPGMNIDVDYPPSWTLSADTTLDPEFTDVGPEILEHDLELRNESTVLTFHTIFGGIGLLPNGYKSSEFDLVEVDEDEQLIRYREKNSKDWTYGNEVSCAESAEIIEAGSDFCVTNAPLSFGNNRPTFVSVENIDDALLAEADAIVLSAL